MVGFQGASGFGANGVGDDLGFGGAEAVGEIDAVLVEVEGDLIGGEDLGSPAAPGVGVKKLEDAVGVAQAGGQPVHGSATDGKIGEGELARGREGVGVVQLAVNFEVQAEGLVEGQPAEFADGDRAFHPGPELIQIQLAPDLEAE